MLLLDEPTNDLDIDTLQQLEDLLDQWAGTMVVVSHDRYLIERVCDSAWALFGDGKLTHLPRGVEQYLEKRSERVKDSTHRQATKLGAEAADASGESKETLTSGGIVKGSAEERELRKDIRRLERTMEKLHTQESQIHGELAATAEQMPVDTEKLAELDRQLKDVMHEIEKAETAWMEKAEMLE